jgi:hypothetical protein
MKSGTSSSQGFDDVKYVDGDDDYETRRRYVEVPLQAQRCQGGICL